jgi:cytochrome P450
MSGPDARAQGGRADFNALAPESFSSAHAQFKELRERCPVARSDAFGGFWAVLGYADVVRVLQDSNTFITSVQNVVPKVAFTGRRPPLHLDPPEHTAYRQVLNPFFTRERIAALEPGMRRTIIHLLEPILRAGGGDFCADFSYRLPGHVFADFFNLSTELSVAIRDVTAQFNRTLQEGDNEGVKKTSLELYAIARDIIALRKAQPLDPRDDLTCAFLAARPGGAALPEDMILGTIRQLIVVGMIAPSTFLGSVAVHLSEHQDIQERLRSDLSLIPAAVDEYLRLLTPYRGFARTARCDVEIGGRLIRKDEPIAVVFASANRDESVFPHSDQFILHRPNIKRHVAFGIGPHQCAGAPLALLMLRLALEELLRRTERIELAGPVTKMTNWPEWGPLSVPVRIIAAA